LAINPNIHPWGLGASGDPTSADTLKVARSKGLESFKTKHIRWTGFHLRQWWRGRSGSHHFRRPDGGGSLSLLLGCSSFWQTREDVGRRSGAVSIGAGGFEPTLIDERAYVTTDYGYLLLTVPPASMPSTYVKAPSVGRLSFSGLVSGLALESKNSGCSPPIRLALIIMRYCGLARNADHQKESSLRRLAAFLAASTTPCGAWAFDGFAMPTARWNAVESRSLRTRGIKRARAEVYLALERVHLCRVVSYGLVDVRCSRFVLKPHLPAKYRARVWFTFVRPSSSPRAGYGLAAADG